MATRVGISGFGRIGRLVTRAMQPRIQSGDIELVASDLLPALKGEASCG